MVGRLHHVRADGTKQSIGLMRKGHAPWFPVARACRNRICRCMRHQTISPCQSRWTEAGRTCNHSLLPTILQRLKRSTQKWVACWTASHHRSRDKTVIIFHRRQWDAEPSHSISVSKDDAPRPGLYEGRHSCADDRSREGCNAPRSKRRGRWSTRQTFSRQLPTSPGSRAGDSRCMARRQPQLCPVAREGRPVDPPIRLFGAVRLARPAKTAIAESSPRGVAIRDTRWKYMDTVGNGEQLFDLSDDPYEQNDLLASGQLSGSAKEALDRLKSNITELQGPGK